VPQIGRSLVRSQLVSLEFFIDKILGSTQPLTEMSPGGKGGRGVRLTNLPPSCAVVMKSGNHNFLELFGTLQACNGTALLLPLRFTYNIQISPNSNDKDTLQNNFIYIFIYKLYIYKYDIYILYILYINPSCPVFFSYVRPSWSKGQYWDMCFIL